MAKKNAIQRRLDKLTELWDEFADDAEPRLLRLLVSQDDMRMIDVFLEVQNDEGGEVPDLFIRFDDPFDNPASYGRSLVATLHQQYQDIQEGLREEGIDADWRCDPAGEQESDVQAFSRHCASLQAHYQQIMVHLVAVLTPQSIADPLLFQGWLQRLLRTPLPQNVRLLLVDDEVDPLLNDLCEAEAALTRTQKPGLDMAGAANELAQEAPADTPGGEFRQHFSSMNHAASKGDLEAADRSGRSALEIASTNNWPQMQVAVHMSLGAMYLGANRSDQALASYRSAGGISRGAAAEGDAASEKLVMQSELAVGTTLLKEGRYPEAADAYQEAAGIATAQEDWLMAMEGWRMAAFCHGQADAFEASWECGHKALDAGEKIDPEERANTTLAYAGEGLIGICEARDLRELAGRVRRRMEGLLGSDWEQRHEAQKRGMQS